MAKSASGPPPSTAPSSASWTTTSSQNPASAPRPIEDDARRRYYRLTKLGRRVLTAECRRLEELVSVIRTKRGIKPAPAES
jgi:hypothetical protein